MKKYNKLDRKDKTEHIIRAMLDKLIESDADLYYSSASDIARRIHKALKEKVNTYDAESQLIIRNIEVDDIKAILSYR